MDFILCDKTKDRPNKAQIKAISLKEVAELDLKMPRNSSYLQIIIIGLLCSVQSWFSTFYDDSL